MTMKAVRLFALATAAVAVTALGGSKANAETELNLTGAVPQSGTINSAIFTTNIQQPTGSGVIHSFVRVSSNADVEQGYNTDLRPIQAGNDANSSPTFTRSLRLSDLQSVTISGTSYYQFLLDINQTGTDPLLDLNELKIYQESSGSLGSYTSAGGFATAGGNAGLVYNLDAGSDNAILLNYNNNSGSGSGDLYAYIPTANFNKTGNFVYLYSSFGEPNNNNDGYEEWAAVVGPNSPVVPLPASLWGGLTLLGLMGAAKIRSRRRSA